MKEEVERPVPVDQMFVPRVARAVPSDFGSPAGQPSINECSKVLVMHSARAQTLARSHTRPPKEEPREEELLALHESRMERNESRRVKRVQGRYCTYRTKHKQ